MTVLIAYIIAVKDFVFKGNKRSHQDFILKQQLNLSNFLFQFQVSLMFLSFLLCDKYIITRFPFTYYFGLISGIPNKRKTDGFIC